MFSSLFGNPDILRELYSAIEGIALPPDIPVDINTLSGVIFKDKINDLSFTIDNRLVVLIEHQSTINNNIPLRLLIYMAKVYEKIVNMKKVYQTKLEKIPYPEFIVLYNGKDKYPDYSELRLSDAFKGTKGLKLADTITVIYSAAYTVFFFAGLILLSSLTSRTRSLSLAISSIVDGRRYVQLKSFKVPGTFTRSDAGSAAYHLFER